MAFRLRRHHLYERAPTVALPSVVGDMGGAQAQLLGAAKTSLWARVRELTPEGLDAAIWRDRTLAKAGCMRRTLHLVPSEDLAVFVRGTALRAEKEIRWVHNTGFPARKLERLLEVVLTTLEQPMTRSELAQRVSRSLGLPLRRTRGGGWGSRRMRPCVKVGNLTFPAYYLIHLAGARGVICSGPNRGSEATFVRADAWLSPWRDVSVERAEEELLRRYLRAFGPATLSDFVSWAGMRRRDAAETWAREEAKFAPVDVEGWPAWVLRRDLGELEASDVVRPTVRILPYFDSFLLGHVKRRHLVDAPAHASVYRGQGWVYPVLLVDGRVEGIWTQVRKGEKLTVRVEAIRRLPPLVSHAIREESRELARFLGCEITEVRIGRAGLVAPAP